MMNMTNGVIKQDSNASWLLTGGTGRLGIELQKLRKFDAPSSKELNLLESIVGKNYDLVLHAAAYTSVDKAETDVEECMRVNVGGTAKLAYAYKDKPFVFISSEHAFHPVNMYSASKFAAEEAIKAICQHYLIIRTL